MSSNAIPIQGLNLRGKVGCVFYNLAAGTTVPIQLFSNSVFDQINMGSQNIFNINEFYSLNTSRFLSSVIIGYGDQERNSIAVENYYSGREISNFKVKNSGLSTSYTSNIHTTIKPFKSINLFGEGSYGQTTDFSQTSSSIYDRSSYSALIKYRFFKNNVELHSKTKRIGKSYDGFSQGIYNSGFSELEGGIKIRLLKRITLNSNISSQKFDKKDEGISGLNSMGLHNNLIVSITSKFIVYAGHSLINARGFDSLAVGNNNLLRSGFQYAKKAGNTIYESSGSAVYTQINRLDSNIVISGLTARIGIKKERVGFGVEASLQEFKGIKNLYGKQITISPDLTIHIKNFDLTGTYKYLISDQSRGQSGFNFRTSYKPSEHFTWEFTGSKWLPIETIYFYSEKMENFRPWYFNVKVYVHLNVLK